MPRRRLLSLTLALLLLAAVQAAAQTSLRVMTFNVRYGTADDGDNAWEKRKDILVNAIKAHAPDVIGMQECLDFQARYVQIALPEYEHFGVGREANGGGERMEIFYRAELLAPIETGHFWLSETPEVPGSRSWKSANVRMASWARFYHRKDGIFFHYLNTHLDHRSEEARAHAAEVLADWAKKTMKETPLIITGDFNAAAENSIPWKTLTEKLHDAWLLAETRVGPVGTWSAFAAPAPDAQRIDWVLLSPGLRSIRCETVLYEESGRYPSDHYPVVAELLLPAPAKP